MQRKILSRLKIWVKIEEIKFDAPPEFMYTKSDVFTQTPMEKVVK